jgi:hypothetical protein
LVVQTVWISLRPQESFHPTTSPQINILIISLPPTWIYWERHLWAKDIWLFTPVLLLAMTLDMSWNFSGPISY